MLNARHKSSPDINILSEKITEISCDDDDTRETNLSLLNKSKKQEKKNVLILQKDTKMFKEGVDQGMCFT